MVKTVRNEELGLVDDNKSFFDGFMFNETTKNDFLDEEKLDSLAICRAEVEHYADQIQKLMEYNLSLDDVRYVTNNLLDFDNSIDLLSGYIRSKKLLSNGVLDPTDLTIKDHLGLFKTLKENNSLIGDWIQTIDYLVDVAHKKDLYLSHTFCIASKLENPLLVSDFFDFFKYNKNMNLDDHLTLYKKNLKLNAYNGVLENYFDEEQKIHLVSEDKLFQEGYRDDWKDGCHVFEHAASRFGD
ncbi:hypothetical protein CMO90_04125 [Candidatus Woesearchaeota archaeon]|nr:hypothetical protein [Candidatus Woesearchaeota archaeon]